MYPDRITEGDFSAVYDAIRSVKGTYQRALVRLKQNIGTLYQRFGNENGTLNFLAMQHDPRSSAIIADIRTWYRKVRGRVKGEVLKSLTEAYAKNVEWTAEKMGKLVGEVVRGYKSAPALQPELALLPPAKGPSIRTVLARHDALGQYALDGAIKNTVLVGATESRAYAAINKFIVSDTNRWLSVLNTSGNAIISSGKVAAFRWGVEVGVAESLETYWICQFIRSRQTHEDLDGEGCDEDGLFWIDDLSAEGPGMFGEPSEDCECNCQLGIRNKE